MVTYFSRICLYMLLILTQMNLMGQGMLNVTYSTSNTKQDNSKSGLINLNISGGTKPYTVNWCEDIAGDTILKGLSSGIYNCRISDSNSDEIFLSIPIGYSFIQDSGLLTFSQNVLGSEENGWVEFPINDINTECRVGFSYSIAGEQNKVAVGYHFNNGLFQIMVDSIVYSLPTDKATYDKGSLFRIVRTASSYKFYKNGNLISNILSYIDPHQINSGMHFGYTIESGNPLLTSGTILSFGPALSNDCDYNKIWVEETTYDEDQNIIAESKVFYDQLGRVVQAQSKNETENQVLAKENIYDKYGRLAISTLPAPISLSSLCYKNNFLRDTTGAAYSLNDFDQLDYPNKLNAVEGSVFNPNRVGQYDEGSLGWYYSDQNYLEPYVATSGFPYTRIEYSNDTRSIAEKTSQPGDVLRLGKGHETESYSVSGGNDLDFAYGLLTDFETAPSNIPFEYPYSFRDDEEGYNPIPCLKTISFDENGKQSVSYSGPRGSTLASCLSGTASGYCADHTVRAKTRMYFSPGERRSLNPWDNNSIDLHLSKLSKANGIDIAVGMENCLGQSEFEFDPNGLVVDLTDLRNDKPLVNHLDYEISSNANHDVHVDFLNEELLNSSVYRIRIRFFEPSTRTMVSAGTPTVYLNYKSDKVRLADISYSIDYSNWTLAYFDKNNGQLLKEVSPKDFTCSYSIGEGKADAPVPQSEVYEFYDANNHQFNLAKSSPIQPANISVDVQDPSYTRNQTISVKLNQKYFPRSYFYSNQPFPHQNGEETLIDFPVTEAGQGRDINDCDFINFETNAFSDPFTFMSGGIPHPVSASDPSVGTYNPSKDLSDILRINKVPIYSEVPPYSGVTSPLFDWDISSNTLRGFFNSDGITTTIPVNSGNGSGGGVPNDPTPPTPNEYCAYVDYINSQSATPSNAYCELGGAEVWIGNPHISNDLKARAAFKGCTDGSCYNDYLGGCAYVVGNDGCAVPCNGPTTDLITFTVYLKATAVNPNNNSDFVVKHSTVSGTVMQGCCKLLWYNTGATDFSFSETELKNKDHFNIQIENIGVYQSRLIADFQHPVTSQGVTSYPTYLSEIQYSWNPDQWQFNNLLAWANLNIRSSTAYSPIRQMEHATSSAYAYDDIGRLVASFTQDEGKTEYKYNDANQIRYKQDEVQRADSKFSFINYDEFGRVSNTGEYSYVGVAGGEAYFLSSLGLNSAPSSGVYTDVGSSTWINRNYIAENASNVADRISYFYDNADPSFPSNTYSGYAQTFTGATVSHIAYNGGANKTWFGYDEYGRTKWVLKNINGLGYKTFDYRYNLLGKLQVVAYQKDDANESFYHKYIYDRDMRLSEVYASPTGTTTGGDIDLTTSLATKMATYKYYLHGPLKRVELGNKLQGIDYVYTIQGWLKSINDPSIGKRDPGQDGHLVFIGNSQSPQQQFNPNYYLTDPNQTSFDAFGMTLDYFPGDYTRENTLVQTYEHPHFTLPSTSGNGNNGIGNGEDGPIIPQVENPADYINFGSIEPHYNGLIQSVRYRDLTGFASLDQFNLASNAIAGPTNQQRMQLFDYDEQYRLKSSIYGKVENVGDFNNYLGSDPNYQRVSFLPVADYLEWGLTYDLNGNIQTLKRNGEASGLLHRDRFTYHYNPVTFQNTLGNNVTTEGNRLNYVNDVAPTLAPGSPNYFVQGITDQQPDNYGYDAKGRITADTKKNLKIVYNSFGKVKQVKDLTTQELKVAYDYNEDGTKLKKTSYGSGGTADKTTWYVNAGGSLMSIYEDEAGDDKPLAQTEVPIYGSGKLGNQFMGVTTTGIRLIDFTQFDITDHLGNVRVTVQNTKDSHGQAIVTGHYDYYAFGGLMPSSTGSNPIGTPNHRTGYQGQEYEPETGLYGFDLRMYEPELGRWLTPDPMRQHFSPYLAMSNNPISFMDPTGGADEDKNGVEDAIDEARAQFRQFKYDLQNELWNEKNRMDDPTYRYSYQGQHSSENNTYLRTFYSSFSNSIFVNAFNHKVEINAPYEQENSVHSESQYDAISSKLIDGYKGLGKGGGIFTTLEDNFIPIDRLLDAVAGKHIDLGFDNAGTSVFESYEQQRTYYNAYGRGLNQFATSMEKFMAATLSMAYGGWIEGAIEVGGARIAASIARREMTLATSAAAKGGGSWVYGAFKTEAKWAGQLSKRGWTAEQITEAVTKGKSFDAVNMVNKANSATRYVHPTTGQSVVIDNVTKELLHVGGAGFKY